MAAIEVDHVSKEFRIHKRAPGLWASARSLLWREYETKKAVDDISFQVERGEIVGYIGPNGAGKSTTIKMLSGILVPTAGSLVVDGRTPHKHRRENALQMGVVFGQRSQLYWDLPIVETFDLYRKMYNVEKTRFNQNVAFYTELLGLAEFLHQPTRQLSLGQKMRANLAIALLHDPQTVYLDEPTIGLDVVGKSRIRRFVREINRERGTTVILTTHDMNDIEQICDRIIMIDKGKIIHDGSLAGFKNQFGSGHEMMVEFSDWDATVSDPRLRVLRQDGPRTWFGFRSDQISPAEAACLITRNHDIRDLSIKEPEVEEIIREFYENQR
jgi:ABC-2 type transport system ATP-binding protein